MLENRAHTALLIACIGLVLPFVGPFAWMLARRELRELESDSTAGSGTRAATVGDFVVLELKSEELATRRRYAKAAVILGVIETAWIGLVFAWTVLMAFSISFAEI